MTYFELVNEVLLRLRENPITEEQLDSNPYYRMIGKHVNDAKDRVEDAWQWSQLRSTDEFTEDTQAAGFPNNSNGPYQKVQTGQVNVILPNSKNNNYLIKRIFCRETGSFLRLYSIPQMRAKYAGVYIGSTDGSAVRTPTGPPIAYSFADDDGATGAARITLYPVPDKEYSFEIDVVRHQKALPDKDPDTGVERPLRVPSLPVYTLATALASRERGEVGGTPVSELFAIADRHLSDSIANDSARFVEEMDWFAEETRWHNTNVGSA